MTSFVTLIDQALALVVKLGKLFNDDLTNATTPARDRLYRIYKRAYSRLIRRSE